MRGDLAGCPTFAPAYVGRKRRAKRTTVFTTPATNAGCPIQAVLWLEWDNGSRRATSGLPHPPKGNKKFRRRLPSRLSPEPDQAGGAGKSELYMSTATFQGPSPFFLKISTSLP